MAIVKYERQVSVTLNFEEISLILEGLQELARQEGAKVGLDEITEDFDNMYDFLS